MGALTGDEQITDRCHLIEAMPVIEKSVRIERPPRSCSTRSAIRTVSLECNPTAHAAVQASDAGQAVTRSSLLHVVTDWSRMRDQHPTQAKPRWQAVLAGFVTSRRR